MTERFRHEAVFYNGLDELVSVVLPFVREGIESGAPVMVALPPDRIRALEECLGPDAAAVEFVDMLEVGANPARIIPAWRRFLEAAEGHTAARGVGEPVWAGRRDVEIDECVLHESLLNLAFDDGPPWQLMCPYDVGALPSRAVDAALRTHPVVDVVRGGELGYQGHEHAFATFGEALPEPPERADAFVFTLDDLAGLRDVVRRLARQAGLGADAAEDIVLAAHELATNSINHGGGSGTLRAWSQTGAFTVEVRDRGLIEDPLVGRQLTAGLSENGRGVWMANQLCDLVQVRSTGSGTVVRLFSWL